jgi:hypothetical protein
MLRRVGRRTKRDLDRHSGLRLTPETQMRIAWQRLNRCGCTLGLRRW